MKALLMNRKSSFIRYIIACFLPVIDQLVMQLMLVMLFASMEYKEIDFWYLTIGLSIGAVILSFILSLTSRLMRIGFMRDILLDIRKQAFDKIMQMEYKTFSKQSKDIYISHLVNDINTFENNFFFNLLNVIFHGGRYVVSAIIVCILDLKVGIVVLALSGVIAALGSLFTKRSAQYQLETTEANEGLTLQASNTFNGLEILKLGGIEERFLQKNIKCMNDVETKKMALSVYTQLQQGVMSSISYGLIILMVIYMVHNVLNGSSFAKEFLVMQMAQQVIFPLGALIPMLNVMKGSVKIYEKITKAEETSVEQTGTMPFVFEHCIEVEDLGFKYGDKKILQHASLCIEKGKSYLIKGMSGAGKSTFMSLLAKVYEDYTGDIRVDGVAYTMVDEKSFNNQIAFIYQDVFLFEDTIANNISLYQPLSQKAILEAAKLAGLEAFLAEQPDGIYTKLEENGKNLSGGQRQRIAIARAIAKKTAIIFVDEGTSALNEEMGRQIEDALLNIGCTVIAISHRYYEGVSEQYDYVVELKGGTLTTYAGAQYFEEVGA